MEGATRHPIQATEPGITIHAPRQINGPSRDKRKPEIETRHGGEGRGPPFHFTVGAGVYVLECANNTYYVGMSWDLERRMTEHFRGQGAMWTQQNPPLRVVRVLSYTYCKNEYGNMRVAEDEVTTKYMKKYGPENVRGGSWVHTDLEECPQLDQRLREEKDSSDIQALAKKLL